MSAPLYREQSGSGAPLVLLHGWGMNLRVFEPLRAALATHYAVTALDLPGHGRSPWSALPREPREALLEGVADCVPRGATLIGWSLGGQLALELAADAHLGISRLVLIATTPRFVCTADWPYGLASSTLQNFGDALAHDPNATVDAFLSLQVRGSTQSEAVLATLRRAVREHGAARPEALAAGLKFLERADQRTLARTLAQPALVISGQYDRISPSAGALELSRLLPGGSWVEIRRAGHVPFLSHPEEVSARVLVFLKDDAGTDAVMSAGQSS